MMVPFRGGSSPLTRGKQGFIVGGIGGDGLIPAHAGKTPHDPAHQSASTAHPCSRGENGGDVSDAAGCGGSSPHTRGKRRVIH